MDIQLNQKDMARLEFISRTIRALRREQKMSQNQLAKLSGLHPSTIKNMERGSRFITPPWLFISDFPGAGGGCRGVFLVLGSVNRYRNNLNCQIIRP
ncbi:MAG: helix-turn-helix domain-containing protein [Emergencia sp.]